ncbi:MAG: glutamyl-tRNA reductase [Candidatus Marinamargulisbacteria bacterium]|jgi:glutamyl-tRNA reductase
MNIGFLGTDFSRSTLQDIETVYVRKEGLSGFFEQLVVGKGQPIEEMVILSTCNRIEYYFTSPDLDAAGAYLKEKIADFRSVTVEVVDQTLMERRGSKLIDHLFAVTSGIESMVFGEYEILGQVKQAHQTAMENKWSGPILNKTFQFAITAGKRVRSETDISRGAYSVSSIAIEAIRETLLDHFDRKILVVGCGTMGERTIKKLHHLGHPHLFVANRTLARAESLASQYDVTVVPFEKMLSGFGDYDIVVSATSAKFPVLEWEMLKTPAKTVLIIDLGVPRNVDAKIKNESTINVKNVPDLREIADRNVDRKKKEIGQIKEIILDESEKLSGWFAHRSKTCLIESE